MNTTEMPQKYRTHYGQSKQLNKLLSFSKATQLIKTHCMLSNIWTVYTQYTYSYVQKNYMQSTSSSSRSHRCRSSVNFGEARHFCLMNMYRILHDICPKILFPKFGGNCHAHISYIYGRSWSLQLAAALLYYAYCGNFHKLKQCRC